MEGGERQIKTLHNKVLFVIKSYHFSIYDLTTCLLAKKNVLPSYALKALNPSNRCLQLYSCFYDVHFMYNTRSGTTRGVTIRFNNDSIRITIRGCRYDTRTILVHLERYDPKRFSDLKSIQ